MNSSSPLFFHPRVVRLQDTDAAGVLFYARLFEWLHDAYAELLTARGFSLGTIVHKEPWALPLVHAEADYLLPLRLDDAVETCILSVELTERAFTVRYEVRRSADGRTAARGRTVHACLDKAQGRGRPLPEELRAALTV